MSTDELGKLNDTIFKLINDGYHTFYCGTYGKFDSQVIAALKEFKNKYPFIKRVKVKPYYQGNRFDSEFARQKFIKAVEEIKYQNNNDKESVDREIEMEERDAKINYANWYKRELEDFDEVFIPACMDDYPYQFRIIECNKWRIKNSDVCVFYIYYKNNTYKLYQFAKKLKKKIIVLFDSTQS